MAERLTDVGVRVLLGQQVASAQRIGAGARLTLVGGDPVDADRVVLAVGRRPRTAGLGLEAPVTAHADVVHPFPTYSEILEGPLWSSPRSCRVEQERARCVLTGWSDQQVGGSAGDEGGGDPHAAQVLGHDR